MAGKAGRDEQPVGPGDGTEHRQPVGREGFDTRPAFGDDAAGQGWVDGARHLQAAAGAILLHLPAVRGLVENERGPAAADEIAAVAKALTVAMASAWPSIGQWMPPGQSGERPGARRCAARPSTSSTGTPLARCSATAAGAPAHSPSSSATLRPPPRR